MASSLSSTRRGSSCCCGGPHHRRLSLLDVPPGFGNGGSVMVYNEAVLRAAGDVHGGYDHSIPFLVALLGSDMEGTRAFACVYTSETGVWGNLISGACPSMVPMYTSSTLVGGSLYWLLGCNSTGILEFDLDRQCLDVTNVPPDISAYSHLRLWIMPGEGGGLGFLHLSGYSAHLWSRKADLDGVAGWVLRRTIELDKLLPLNPGGFSPLIFGFAEEDSFLATNTSIFASVCTAGI